MIFTQKNENKNKMFGTPTKKVKVNESSDQLISEFQIPLNNLVFIRNISKFDQKDDLSCPNPFKNYQVGDFFQGPLYTDNNKQNQSHHINKQQQSELQHPYDNEQQLPAPKFFKKFTMGEKILEQKQYDNLMADLNLSRHNSTFPISNLNQENINLGQNIYLSNLLKLQSKLSVRQAVIENQDILRKNKFVMENEDIQNRLVKDYEIKQNLGKVQSNKIGYICLNKLQKIFYYVKRVITKTRNTLPFQQTYIDRFSHLQSLIELKAKPLKKNLEIKAISDQLRVYHKDSQSYFPRFYQQWLQNDSIYMIFELGSYSLRDKTEVMQKLPQNQIWSIIYDITKSLKWLYQNEKVHLNIKPGNIIKCRTKYKLMDPFVYIENLSNFLSNISISNNIYYAPELIEFQKYLDGLDFTKCQIYSLGISIIQNISVLPNNIKSAGHSTIKNYVKKYLHGYSSYLKRLLLRMIDKNSKRRPTFDQLLCQNIHQDNFRDKNTQKNKIKFKRSNSI